MLRVGIRDHSEGELDHLLRPVEVKVERTPVRVHDPVLQVDGLDRLDGGELRGLNGHPRHPNGLR